MESFLMMLPILVILWLSGRRTPYSSRSSVIVLNFMMKKAFSSFPGRSWKKKGFPRLTNHNRIVESRSTGDASTSMNREAVKSKKRLKMVLYKFFSFLIGIRNSFFKSFFPGKLPEQFAPVVVPFDKRWPRFSDCHVPAY